MSRFRPLDEDEHCEKVCCRCGRSISIRPYVCAKVGRCKSKRPKLHTFLSAEWVIGGQVKRGVSLSEVLFEDGLPPQPAFCLSVFSFASGTRAVSSLRPCFFFEGVCLFLSGVIRVCPFCLVSTMLGRTRTAEKSLQTEKRPQGEYGACGLDPRLWGTRPSASQERGVFDFGCCARHGARLEPTLRPRDGHALLAGYQRD